MSNALITIAQPPVPGPTSDYAAWDIHLRYTRMLMDDQHHQERTAATNANTAAIRANVMAMYAMIAAIKTLPP